MLNSFSEDPLFYIIIGFAIAFVLSKYRDDDSVVPGSSV